MKRNARSAREGARTDRRVVPFFLLAALDALINMLIWLVAYFHPGLWPSQALPAMYWHAHEMLFGFVTAAISGFLLAAAPGWTGRSTPSGASTIPLAFLWLAGRVAMMPFVAMPHKVASFVDLAFLPALVFTLVPPLVRARKFRNFSFIWPLGALFLANISFHLGMNGTLEAGEHIGLAVSIDVVTILIVVVGGRLIPAFTRSGLNGQDIAAHAQNNRWIEFGSIASVVAVLAVDIGVPLSAFGGAVALVAGLAQGFRIMRWLDRSGMRNPLISVFHVGYAWLMIGLLLKGIWLLTVASFADKWIHALTVGGFGTMILAVMARTSPARTAGGTKNMPISYSLISVAACIRVFAPSLLPDAYTAIVAVSGLLWIVAFAIFLGTYILASTEPRTYGRST